MLNPQNLYFINTRLSFKDSVDHNNWLLALNDYNKDDLQHLTHRFALTFGGGCIESIECVDSGVFNSPTIIEKWKHFGEELVEL